MAGEKWSSTKLLDAIHAIQTTGCSQTSKTPSKAWKNLKKMVEHLFAQHTAMIPQVPYFGWLNLTERM